MNDSATDVHQLKTYGREKVTRQFLWLAAIMVALSVLGVSIPHPRPSMTTLGWVMGLAGLAVGAFALIRSSFPPKPLLELSPAGIRLRTIGDIFIPWREVRGIDSIDLTAWPARTAPFPVKFKDFTVVLVSRDFYESSIIPAGSAIPTKAWELTFLPKGSTVQVALHHDVLPVAPDELRREVAARWYAFRDQDRPAASPPAPAVQSVAFRVNWKKN